MVQSAIDAEVEAFIGQHAHRRDEQGKRLVVKNGNLPEREILTGAGAILIGDRGAIRRGVRTVVISARLTVAADASLSAGSARRATAHFSSASANLSGSVQLA